MNGCDLFCRSSSRNICQGREQARILGGLYTDPLTEVKTEAETPSQNKPRVPHPRLLGIKEKLELISFWRIQRLDWSGLPTVGIKTGCGKNAAIWSALRGMMLRFG